MTRSRKTVDIDNFQEWAQRHFKDIKVKNNKILLNSIYCDHLGGDEKHHLWCRPYTGHFHCYKSGKKDSLYQLVMDVERCSYTEAVDMLGGEQSLRYLEEKLEAFLAGETIPVEEDKAKLQLPKEAISVSKLLSPHKEKVTKYLESRKIPPNGFHYCIDGKYAGRIIIPYYNSDGELIYFNGRDIRHPKPYLRYRGPEIDTGFKKDEVVWMSFFPRKGKKVYLTEGEFDAMTLDICGLHGCATGGKEVSEKQALMLAGYDVCLAFDADVSGGDAFKKAGWMLKQMGFTVSFIRPPAPYKDWNEMLTGNKNNDLPAKSEKLIRGYIEREEEAFDLYTASVL